MRWAPALEASMDHAGSVWVGLQQSHRTAAFLPVMKAGGGILSGVLSVVLRPGMVCW